MRCSKKLTSTEKFRIPGLWNKGCEWCKQRLPSHKWSRHWGGITCARPSPAKPATATKLRDTSKSYKIGVYFPPYGRIFQLNYQLFCHNLISNFFMVTAADCNCISKTRCIKVGLDVTRLWSKNAYGSKGYASHSKMWYVKPLIIQQSNIGLKWLSKWSLACVWKKNHLVM